MEKKKRTHKRFYWLALIPLVAGAAYYFGHQPKAEAKPTTTEVTATKGDLVIGFESDGKSQLPYGNLDFEVSGKLTEIDVRVGDHIVPGQIVAKIDDTDYKRSYLNAKIAYEKAQINYTQKQSSLSQTLKTEADKLVTLKQQWQVAQTDYDNAVATTDNYSRSEVDAFKRTADNAKRAYELALNTYNYDKADNSSLALEKLNMETAKVQLEQAKDNLDKTVLYATKPGVILNIGKLVGDNIVISNNNNTSDSDSLSASTSHLMVFSDSKAYQVVTDVSEQDLPLVSIGQKVNVTFDALEGKTYTGKVIQIDKLPTTDSSGIVSYAVTAELDSGFNEIGIGMTCTVQLVQKEALGVIIVPNKAVTMENGVQYVTVKNQDGSTTKTAIKAGLTDGRNAAVTEGLRGDETLIVTEAAKAE